MTETTAKIAKTDSNFLEVRCEVRFPYTAVHVKNHWVSFASYGDNVRSYFEWAKENLVVLGREGTQTPETMIPNELNAVRK